LRALLLVLSSTLLSAFYVSAFGPYYFAIAIAPSIVPKTLLLDSATRANTLPIIYWCVRIAGIVRVCSG